MNRTSITTLVSVLLVSAMVVSGCGPKYSYPGSEVPKAIEDISKNEHNIEVQARVVGKTVGALSYLDNLAKAADPQGAKDIQEKMWKILSVIIRVALSSDLPLEYSVVVLRDKSDGNQLVVTRSLDDARRQNADMLGLEESVNRITFGQEKLEPTEDKETFVLKEVRYEKFLAEQMAQRIRYWFMKGSPEDGANSVIVDGNFDETEKDKVFRFSIVALKASDPNDMMINMFKIVNQVLEGYRFQNFDRVEIQDYLNRQKLVVDKQAVILYQNKELTDEDILENYLLESQSIQEVFKLFDVNMPKESTETTDPAVIPAQSAVTP